MEAKVIKAGAPAGRNGIALESYVMQFALALLLVSAVIWADRPPTMEKTDFSVTYIGSRMVYLGLGSKLYDLGEQGKLKKALLPHAEPLLYEHPPFEALLLAPLGALPYKAAYLIWGLLNAAIWLSLPGLLRPYANLPRDEIGYLLLWLLFAPLGVALFQGQSSILILLLYSLTFIELKKGRAVRAGAIFGLALLKFQFAIPFALIFLLRRQWQFMKGFIASAGVLGGLSLIAVGWQGIEGYVRLLVGIGGHPDDSSYGAAIGMATVQGFSHAVLGSILSPLMISIVVASLSISILVWTAWTWRKADLSADSRSFELMFACAIVASLVTGFHMFTHDLSPLALAILLAAANLPAEGAIRRILLWTMGLFLLPPVYFVLMAWHRMYLMFPALTVFGLATCAAVRPATATGSISLNLCCADRSVSGDQ